MGEKEQIRDVCLIRDTVREQYIISPFPGTGRALCSHLCKLTP